MNICVILNDTKPQTALVYYLMAVHKYNIIYIRIMNRDILANRSPRFMAHMWKNHESVN